MIGRGIVSQYLLSNRSNNRHRSAVIVSGVAMAAFHVPSWWVMLYSMMLSQMGEMSEQSSPKESLLNLFIFLIILWSVRG